MKFAVCVAVAFAVAPVAVHAAGSAMPVSTFISKSEALKSRGPLAMLSSDLKLLMNQVKADSAELRAENVALQAAGRPRNYCPPASFRMSEKDIMAAMQAVPTPRRTQTSTKDALRQYIARKHPCRG